jgi:hypothetical protein
VVTVDNENMSRYATVLEQLGIAITNDTEFNKVPVRWDMIEVMPDNMATTEIVLQGKPYKLDATGCVYERQLDIIIIHNTNHTRSITLRLTKYAETMKEIIDNVLLTTNLDLTFLQTSEIRAMRNNREDSESYKGSKTLFSSMIVMSYLLRY